jgi:hypothetical protein
MDHPANAPIYHIVVMNSAIPTTADDEERVLQSLLDSQMNGRKWGDISVHYLIGPSGKVYQGRLLRYRADGTVGTGMGNDSHLWGKCAIMTLSEGELTAEASEALRTLVDDRITVFNEYFREPLKEQQARLKASLGPAYSEDMDLDQVRLRFHPALHSSIKQLLEGGEQPAGQPEEDI